jgi:Phytochelatin synthase
MNKFTLTLCKNWLPLSAAALFACGMAYAETLPLAPDLVSLTSDAGEHLLEASTMKQPYLPLTVQFVTQKSQVYCGVASMVMVLNALGVPAPTTPEYAPFHFFTQENILNEATEHIIPQAAIAKNGMNLDQLSALLTTYGVDAVAHHASELTVDTFRKQIIEEMKASNHFVLVNYLRKEIGQERGGHISPLASYDAQTDRVLILDVSRYKYPPVWVKVSQLFNAMNTPDSDNQNRSRGFVTIRRLQKEANNS